MKVCLFITGLLMSALVTNVYAAKGAGSSGGGDANSVEIRKIKNYFTSGKETLTKELTASALNLTLLPPVGEMSKLVHELVARGIVNDFNKANYELRSTCLDEEGIERSASTMRTNLSNKPELPSPVICINVRKLAQEKASLEKIVGLLYHEHARHFGVEDTDELGYHPLADYVTTSYPHAKWLKESKSVGQVAIDGNNLFTTDTKYNLKIKILKLDGDCDDLIGTFPNGESITLRVGENINLSGNVFSDIQTVPAFYDSYRVFKFSNNSKIFQLGKKECRLEYTISESNGTSKIFRYSFGSGSWSEINVYGVRFLDDLE